MNVFVSILKTNEHSDIDSRILFSFNTTMPLFISTSVPGLPLILKLLVTIRCDRDIYLGGNTTITSGVALWRI